MRVLSGIQPSGIPHLGNYFGMMKPSIELQEKGDCFYFIAEYHAMTSLQDGDRLRELTRGIAMDFLACGLDPNKATLFRQSAIPELHELAWYLSTLAPMGLLERCHSYKDKIAKGISPNHGLFAYPVLMAADILMYQSNVVPVGQDQKQHVEVTRDLAGKFNDAFGETFVMPEPRIREDVATLPGVDGQKMSKSYHNTIELFAAQKPFRKRVMGIVTDSTPVEDPKPTNDSVILSLYATVASEEEVASMKASMEAGGTGYGDYKKQLFERLWDFLGEFREKREALENDPAYVDDVLKQGSDKARAIAMETMDKVRFKVGV